MMSFENLGLSQPVLQALALKDYSTSTPIQEQAIPILLKGRDLLGIAQTGTGKTAAFMLPSIDRLVASGKRPQRGTCRMLVLAPTRELASQIAESARAYGRFSHISVATVFGGTSINKNRQDLSRGVDVLVATPGRLLDLVEQRWLDLRQVEILVLDEADQMLDLGFIHALKRIVKLLPAKRQSLFFSATMPKNIAALADEFLTRPAQVAVAPVATTAERVEQRVMFVSGGQKPALLAAVLQDEAVERVLVFTRTKHGADKVVRSLGQAGIEAAAIHGNKSQPQRERALAGFRSGHCRVLVATDIAARGIDVEGVTHVINYDLPNVPESYVHRIGRTARAGAAGIALSFCNDEERAYLRDIERLTRQKVPVEPLPKTLPVLKPVAAPPDDRRPQRAAGRPHDRKPSAAPPKAHAGPNGTSKKRHQRRGGGAPQPASGGGLPSFIQHAAQPRRADTAARGRAR
ncbi:MAG TPA: DEAD/DEAH box helicase [Beijerinckiaceae bacterium]|nr:DEAD/DEAH box helicase [Beijerinckiaceae bacterium]